MALQQPSLTFSGCSLTFSGFSTQVFRSQRRIIHRQKRESNRPYYDHGYNVFLSKNCPRNREPLSTSLKRCYFADYRFSEDLDFTLLEPMEMDTVCKELEPVFAETHRASGIRFSMSPREKAIHPNSFTFYLAYEGPIRAAREVKVDITHREQLVFPLNRRTVLGYDEYTDLPHPSSVQVYDLAEIGAEKVVALQDRARNEPRDLYDVWYLLQGHHLRLDDIAHAVEEKWKFRHANSALVRGQLAAKETRYSKLWQPRLSPQMIEIPSYEEVFRSVQRAFRQAGLP